MKTKHKHSNTTQYYDVDGKEVSLRQLVIKEPDWAVSRIAAADAIPEVCVNCGSNDHIGCSTKPIPDAPVVDQSLTGVYQVSAIATKPVPSRTELIELMREAYWPNCGERVSARSMGDVLDALIKAGAVK